MIKIAKYRKTDRLKDEKEKERECRIMTTIGR